MVSSSPSVWRYPVPNRWYASSSTLRPSEAGDGWIDFVFSFKPEHEPLVRACMQAAKRRARPLVLSWRTRRLASNRIHVAVHGGSPDMDLLGHRLERDPPIIAEGVNLDLPVGQRRRLGLGSSIST
jgi:hypothetical protein